MRVTIAMVWGALASGWTADAVAQVPDGSSLESICAGARAEFPLPAFEAFDRDGDERLTRTEAATCRALDETFARLDLDADQMLTRFEYRAFAALWTRRQRSFGGEDVGRER